jgi:outer membrane receptor protein involved in Fe transport
VLQEVVVTAQKREQRLQDVPVPVTALNARDLTDNNQLRLRDYYTDVPGLNLVHGAFGDTLLSIRGISSSGSYVNPTVGIMIDDVPFGATTSLGGGSAAPDIDPSDLARIEVLRGPQGTLYGANSIGGLVKFVTLDPSTTELTGRLQLSGDDVSRGEGLGYNARGSANIPLTDWAAVRASAFAGITPGYIDDVNGGRGVNRTNSSGGRLAGLVRFAEDWSLKLSALLQHTETDGLPAADPTLGDLKQNAAPGTGDLTRTTQAYSATLTGKIAGITLTSLSGYSLAKWSSLLDYGPYIPGFALRSDARTSKYSQEIRLTASAGPRLDWLVGGFYTHEDSPLVQTLAAYDPTTGALTASTAFGQPNTYTEVSGFADFTVHVLDQLDVQFGGRESENRQTLAQTTDGTATVPKGYSRDHSFTYLVSPQFHYSADAMVYARIASGYRPGGPNFINPTPGANTPPSFGPDKTLNYELGIKTDVWDHRLALDGSVYYIKWKDIQIPLIQDGFGYFINGGDAKSEGVELSATTKPLTGLTLSGWLAYDEAVLTATLPPTSSVYGAAGDRLPSSPRWSGHFSADQEFRVYRETTGFLGATASYVGDRLGTFTGSQGLPSPRQIYPSYSQIDLRAGVRDGTWTYSVVANNVTDKRGILYGGLGGFYPNDFYYIEPRVVTLSVSKRF